MLNLSIINSKATIKANANKTKASVQLNVYNGLLVSKTMNYNNVFDIVCDYTLQPTKQLDTWFKTEALYNEFANAIPTIKTVEQMNAFKTKYNEFFTAMNKKTFDLFFNVKHQRSFVNNKAYNTNVIVNTIFDVNGNIDKVQSSVTIK